MNPHWVNPHLAGTCTVLVDMYVMFARVDLYQGWSFRDPFSVCGWFVCTASVLVHPSVGRCYRVTVF